MASLPELKKKAVSAKVAATNRSARYPEQVGVMPDLVALGGQRRNQMGMAMTEAGDPNAADEIEVARAVGGEEITALAPFEGEVGPHVKGHQGRNHD